LTTMTRVFVYGSLLSGEPNHRVLRGARRVGEARTAARFALHDLGAYPAMIDGGARAIAGEVYEVDEKTLARLDVLEGHPRYYRRAAITLADGSFAETYLLTPAQVEGRPLITSGNWRGRRREKIR
jgi:gamma-glutamylaminecyclotransferase